MLRLISIRYHRDLTALQFCFCIFRVIPECQAIMDEHQGRKSEIDAREEKIAAVLATGEQMIEKGHFAGNEVFFSLTQIAK